MTTDNIIEILSKYPNQNVTFDTIRDSEYEIFFDEIDNIIHYEGKPVEMSICKECGCNTNIRELHDAFWLDKTCRIEPLKIELLSLVDKQSNLEINKDSISIIRDINKQIEDLKKQIDDIHYEVPPISKSVVFAVIKVDNGILVLS